MGKGNPKLLTWDFNREATVQVQDALFSPKSASLLTGNALLEEESGTIIHKREKLTVDESNTVTLSETPDSPSTTLFVYKYVDGEDATEQTLGDPATTENTYSITDKVITLNATSCPEGTEVVVYYRYASSSPAKIITITSDSFPGYYKMVGDTVIRNNKTGQDEPFQVVINKCKIQPAFTMSFQAEGDPTVFDMNLEVFREDANTKMVTMIKY